MNRLSLATWNINSVRLRIDRVVAFLKREKPDVVQVNYSITERLAEDRLIPFIADRGVALVDASHPDQWVNIPASRNGRTVAIGNRVAALLARFGFRKVESTHGVTELRLELRDQGGTVGERRAGLLSGATRTRKG